MQTLGDAVNLFKCCIFTLNAFTIVLPAFLIAGALVVFIPSQSVMKYLGAKANRVLSYGVSAISGNVLTVCSCNVVPIFASILRRGAGIGPAFCFVFAAPAIHVVNTVFTYQVIGPKLALWRFVTVPIIAVLVGLAMALLFRREERARQCEIQGNASVALLERSHEETRRGETFLLMLIAVLFFGAWLSLDPYFSGTLWGIPAGQLVRLAGVIIALAALVKLSFTWFGREETAEWGRQTWLLLRMIVPIFVVAVLVIAVIVAHIPLKWIMPSAGDHSVLRFGQPQGNGILPTFLAAVFGTVMYFPLLTEVAFTKGLLLKYFALGPALAILLGGPGLSLPGLILVRKVAGLKKMLVYWAVTVSLITLVAYFFGRYFGEYECSCQRQGAAKPPTEVGPWSLIGAVWYVGLMAWIIATLAKSKRAASSAAEDAA
ncbi:MAG: permease [Armatimonadota bacterium]